MKGLYFQILLLEDPSNSLTTQHEMKWISWILKNTFNLTALDDVNETAVLKWFTMFHG